MPAAYKLFVNQSASDTTAALVNSFTDDGLASPPIFTQGDTGLDIEIHFLVSNPEGATDGVPFTYSDPATWTVKFGVGDIDAPVTGGTFTLTDPAGSQTTGAIDYNASASTVQTAIRAALTTNYANATVTGDAGGPWTIDRVTLGSLSSLTATMSGIAPSGSVAEIVNTQDGSASLSEIFNVRLTAGLAIFKESSWTALPAATAAVTAVTTGSSTANEVQRVTWSSDAYAGALTLTAALPASGAITASSIANPTIVTSASHGLISGDSITIASSNTTPTIDGARTVTVIDANRFSIPVNVTVAGTAGSWTATLTRTLGPIPYNVEDTALEDILEEHSSNKAIDGSFGVVKNAPGDYSITFKGDLGNTDIATMTVAQTLSVPVGVRGTINCNTAGVLELIGSSTTDIDTQMEIEKTVSGETTTVARGEVIIRPELISGTPGTSTPTQLFQFDLLNSVKAANFDATTRSNTMYILQPSGTAIVATMPDGSDVFNQSQTFVAHFHNNSTKSATVTFQSGESIHGTSETTIRVPAYETITVFNRSSSTWHVTRGDPPGMIKEWPAYVKPNSGWELCYGQALSRTTYSNLFETICPTSTFTITIASPGVITWTAHGLQTGAPFKPTTTGALPTGMVSGTTYYVIEVDANTFRFATSLANAVAGTAVNTSGSQSGVHTALVCPYGFGDGSTTFNLPDLRGFVVAGNDKMGGTSANRLTVGVNGDILGNTGGSETISTTVDATVDDSGSADFVRSVDGFNIQPTIILNKIIKL